MRGENRLGSLREAPSFDTHLKLIGNGEVGGKHRRNIGVTSGCVQFVEHVLALQSDPCI